MQDIASGTLLEQASMWLPSGATSAAGGSEADSGSGSGAGSDAGAGAGSGASSGVSWAGVRGSGLALV